MKEEDIRPRKYLDEFLSLSREDCSIFKNVGVEKIPCVACGSEKISVEFVKEGFTYSRCNFCGTLFNSPRAPMGVFSYFYKNSKSWRYWSDIYFPVIAESRLNKIIVPRVNEISNICKKNKLKVNTIVDVGAGYGFFLDEWRKQHGADSKCIAIEPSPILAKACRDRELSVIESDAENVHTINKSVDLVVCFEVLEHVPNPVEFLSSLYRMIKPNGGILVTTLSADGFDLSVLGKLSSSIFPPHHINFPSINGFTRLFERSGFASVDVTTPGKLDVNIIENAVKNNPELLINVPYLKYFLNHPKELQRFLVSQKLSSHCWIFARKLA